MQIKYVKVERLTVSVTQMHKILEFQAVVLAAGRGSRLPDVGGTVSKCLLPIGPYPVLWYPLNMLEKLGFQETMVIVLDEDKSSILSALEKCPLKIKYELIVIPSDEDWGTANSLRHISNRVTSDLIVVSGDLLTNINLNEVLNLYRKHDATLATLFFNNGPEEWIELPGLKSKAKPDRDLVCIDKETQRLVFLASASDFEENVTLPRILMKKYNSLSMYSRLLDAHVYVMKYWVVNYLVEVDKFTSVKGELIPHIVKKQLSKPKNFAEKNKGTSEKNIIVNKDIFDYAIDQGYESKIRAMSAYNDHRLGSKGVYYNDQLRCYAHIPDKNIFGVRINTLSAFCLTNFKIQSKWEEITGSPFTNIVHPNSEVKTKQIVDSTVGEKSVIQVKTSIKNCVIGSNCTIDDKVRLTNCVLMNNVNIKEGCVLLNCVVYTGATIEANCSLQFSLVGPHHEVPASTSSTHQLYAETTDNMITLG